MTDWRELRNRRITDVTSDRFVIEGGDARTNGFLYTRDILMTEAAANILDRDPDLGAAFSPPKDTFARLRETGVQVRGFARDDHLPTVVRQIQELVARETGDVETRHVSLNYGITGEPIYKGGPAAAPEVATDPWVSEQDWGTGDPVVAVLDTGVAPTGTGAPVDVTMDAAPDDLDGLVPTGAPAGSPLASEAGHGTFIAGLIHRYAGPGVRIAVERVLDPDGLGDDATVSSTLLGLLAKYPSLQVISLSFGTFGDTPFFTPMGLEKALAAIPDDVAIVAAAGNAADPLNPWYPAAHPRVVGVASVRPGASGFEPSPFSNSGPSADVCTYGEKLLSIYVTGDFVADDPSDVRTFDGWARWSGTSFAAPLLAAEITRRVVSDGLTGAQAWASLKASLAPAALAPDPLAFYGQLYDPCALGLPDPTGP